MNKTNKEQLEDCITAVSSYYAGWDYYDMPRAQRQREKASAEAARIEGSRLIKLLTEDELNSVNWGLCGKGEFNHEVATDGN
jgi:hypothetical protein